MLVICVIVGILLILYRNKLWARRLWVITELVLYFSLALCAIFESFDKGIFEQQTLYFIGVVVLKVVIFSFQIGILRKIPKN
jgi:hypothetical protein